MRTSAKLFVALMLSLGATCWAIALLHWAPQFTPEFAIFLIVSGLASGMKVHLPAVTGTMSVSFFFMLIGIADLSLPETLIAGCAAILCQYVWQSTKRLRAVQVLFNIANVTLAITVSFWVFHSAWLHAQHIEYAVLLGIMTSTYFMAQTLPVAVIISLTEERPMFSVWRSSFFWSFPYYILAASALGAFHALSGVFGWQTSLLTLPLLYVIYRSYRIYVGRLETEKMYAEERTALHLKTIKALALAIEAKDTTTHDHLQRVEVYAIELGRDLGVQGRELEALRAAALLHDIGKIAVPEHIISKPGRLTPEEFEKMKIHPVVGAEILESVDFPYPVAPLVRSHHEKWDGSGYPDGLQGENIPLGSRILAAVDTLDALASDRQYRRALPLDEAMKIIVNDSGKAFDPKVVELLSRRYTELEKLARIKPSQSTRLSVDVKVERGGEPGAGFQQEAPSGETCEISESLWSLTEALGPRLTLYEMAAAIEARLHPIIPHDTIVLYMLRGEELEPVFVSGDQEQLYRALRIPYGQGLSGWVAKNNMPILNGNPAVESGYLSDPARFTTLRSALASPIAGAAGMVGVLALYSEKKDGFAQSDLRLLQSLCSKLGHQLQSSSEHSDAVLAAAVNSR